MVTKEQLDQYLKAYSSGSSEISDEAYDELLEEYLKEHGEDKRPFTRNKQSAAINDVVGTLGKVYGVVEPMREGQMAYTDWVYRRDIPATTWFVPQAKLDGCSVAFDLQTERFFTRGDVDNGESVDVTSIFRDHINKVKAMLEACNFKLEDVQSVKFEAILNIAAYYQFKDLYKRPRDFVAATITSRNEEYARYISLVPLRVYSNGRQYIPITFINDSCIFAKSQDFETIAGFVKTILDRGAHTIYGGLDYECDGVVVSKINHMDGTYRGNKGPSDMISPYDFTELYFVEVDPECEVAIKILNKVEETKLINIDWHMGLTGRITPVAVVEPVKFDTITVTNIGLSTFDRVMNLGLKYGDTVRIVYNIVPYLLDSKHDGTIPVKLPENCPECGHPLDMRLLKQMCCTNPDCRSNKLGSIIRYCRKMKMFGVSEGVLSKLFDNGYIKSISDLYTMDLMEASEISGLGEKSLQNVVQNIKDASNGIPVYRWLGALPCKNVSDKTWKHILKIVYGYSKNMNEDITALCLQDTPDAFLNTILLHSERIGPITASSINEGIRNCWNDIHTIISYITFDEINHNTKGIVCLSGTRDKRLILKLTNMGYAVTDHLTKECKCVIVPDTSFTSGKVSKAKSIGIPVYTIYEFEHALQ